MGLYEEQLKMDIISPIMGKLPIHFTSEGEPKIYLKSEGVPNSPWIINPIVTDRSCAVWSDVYFTYYGIIPQGCRSCWKVVMEIGSVKQLLRIEAYQQSCKYQCKCGIETRPETGKLGKSGGYWYAPLADGLAGGRKMHRWLQKEFPGVKLLLKRGCSEMERRWNPSDKWDELAERASWNGYEQLLNTLFVLEYVAIKGTSEMFKPLIRVRWIESAFEHGDESYLEFVDKPFKRDYLTYQSSIHNKKDFTCSFYEPVKVKGTTNYGTFTKPGTDGSGDNHRSGKVPDAAEEQSKSDERSSSGLTLL